MATARNFEALLEDDLGLPRGQLKDNEESNRSQRGEINNDRISEPSPARVMANLKNEVDELECQIQNLLRNINQRSQNASSQNPIQPVVKHLLKPRDIPILELRHLSGVEGAGRLGVFLSQVENCSDSTEERQQIVRMRVDANLAIFVQNILRGSQMSWLEFKKLLTAELTDQSEERIFDCLNDQIYTLEDDPVEFVSRIKCKLALLETQTETGDVPKRDRLIKNKLIKGMPKDSRDRLELFLDENISLQRFLKKLNTERLILLSQNRNKVRTVEPTTQPTRDLSNLNPPPFSTAVRNNRGRGERQWQAWDRREKYCPYCRASNHTIAECYRKPRPGSCFDCLRMGCRRGQPGCPGRINMMRGRMQ